MSQERMNEAYWSLFHSITEKVAAKITYLVYARLKNRLADLFITVLKKKASDFDRQAENIDIYALTWKASAEMNNKDAFVYEV